MLGTAALDSLLGDARVIWDDVPAMVLASALDAAFLAPFVVPAVDWLDGPTGPGGPMTPTGCGPAPARGPSRYPSRTAGSVTMSS